MSLSSHLLPIGFRRRMALHGRLLSDEMSAVRKTIFGGLV
jgi:hypothetical protein